jgi:hypothetical protein
MDKKFHAAINVIPGFDYAGTGVVGAVVIVAGPFITSAAPALACRNKAEGQPMSVRFMERKTA